MSEGNKQKKAIGFVVRFFVIYIIGALAYQFYLSRSEPLLDPISCQITHQVATFMDGNLPHIEEVYSDKLAEARINYMGVTILRIIEGCNAVSVMILFLAFLAAFKGRWKDYVWFIPSGLVILYTMNVLRIILLGYITLYYNEWTGFAHDFIFPAIIYGTVVLLWIVWITYIVKPKDAH